MCAYERRGYKGNDISRDIIKESVIIIIIGSVGTTIGGIMKTLIGTTNLKMRQVLIEKREIVSGYKEITDQLERRGPNKVKKRTTFLRSRIIGASV